MNPKNSYNIIDAQTLSRYVAARKNIDEKAERISNISHMLGLLKYCHEDKVPVDPQALHYFAEMINHDICKIMECLDDFINIMDINANKSC